MHPHTTPTLAAFLVLLLCFVDSSCFHDIVIYGDVNDGPSPLSPTCKSSPTCRLRNSVAIDNASIVIFDAASLGLHPPKKANNQIWVYRLSSPNIYVNETILLSWKRHFNWTMGYRSDSDLVEKMEYVEVPDFQLPVNALVYFRHDNDTHLSVSIATTCFTVSCVEAKKDGTTYAQKTAFYQNPFFSQSAYIKKDLSCNNRMNKQIYDGFCDAIWRKSFLTKHDNYVTASTESDYEHRVFLEGTYAMVKVRNIHEVNSQIIWNHLGNRPWWHGWLTFHQFSLHFQLCNLCSKLSRPIERNVYNDITSWLFS